MSSNHLPFKCETLVPERDQASHDVIPRWSDTYVDLPAVIVKPDSEDDIIDAINYSKQSSITLVTANGARAPFVPITGKTLYLDMQKFNQVSLDKSAGTVRIGGGASTGDVIKSITAEGYYTLWPNSNTVGYVGCVLGGGSDTMNGLHGYMVDAVESFQLITADGEKLEVSPRSQGRERALFNALCGAGFGLGIVVSVVMKAFPLPNLNLTSNSIWTRRVVLPPTAIGLAAQTFVNVRDLSPALMLTMICMRSPPSSATPGAPMIMMTGSYFGPSDEGEAACASLFHKDLISQAIHAATELVPFADANQAARALSANGGHKGFSSTFLETLDARTIEAAFKLWLQLGEKYEDARPTALIFNKWDTKAIVANGQTDVGRAKFFEPRRQSMMASAARSCTKDETRPAMDRFGEDFLKIVRRDNEGPPRTFANNLRPGMDMEELHSKERLAELRNIKAMWDPQGIFWSPAY